MLLPEQHFPSPLSSALLTFSRNAPPPLWTCSSILHPVGIQFCTYFYIFLFQHRANTAPQAAICTPCPRCLKHNAHTATLQHTPPALAVNPANHQRGIAVMDRWTPNTATMKTMPDDRHHFTQKHQGRSTASPSPPGPGSKRPSSNTSAAKPDSTHPPACKER